MTVQIVFLLLLIVLNGIFAMSEIAVVSARKSRLQQRADEGDRSARTALELANAPNRFLSTVQIGITMVGVLAGAYGGAMLAEPLSAWLATFPALAPYSDALGLGLVVLAITYLSLVLGELVPKRIGLNAPERIAAFVARPMHLLSVVVSPLVHLLSGSTDLVLRLLRMRPAADAPITEEEISVLLGQGAEAGVFEEAEQDMVERIFRFGDQSVGSIMTPRREIVYLDVNDPPEANLAKMAGEAHTRFVVCDHDIDHVLGVVHVKDLLVPTLKGRPLDLMAALRKPHFVPESVQALRVIELFKSSGIHIALVVDEYGGIEGLITLDDVLEAIVGDIPWVGETTEPDIVQRDDGSWLIDGMVPIEEFKDLFDLRTLPGEDRGNFRTLGGFVVTHLGRIPTVADSFVWDEMRFEVVDMDGNRVDKVLVTPTTDEAAAEEA